MLALGFLFLQMVQVELVEDGVQAQEVIGILAVKVALGLFDVVLH